MLGQFHDCLPGTTIRAVVDDNLEIYARRTQQAQKLIDAALSSLRSSSEGQTVIDPLRLVRNEVVESDGKYSWLSTDSTGVGAITSSPSNLTLPKVSSQGDSPMLDIPSLYPLNASHRSTITFIPEKSSLLVWEPIRRASCYMKTSL
jgi:hypothetical protein